MQLRLAIALGAMMLALPLAAQDKRPAPQKTGAPTVPVEQRIALVIGNGQYKDSPLANPVNDARAIARALTSSGFKVVEKENLSQQDFQIALRNFGDALKHGGVGLFYYAGHGMQVKGRNFLIPVDAHIEREDEVAYNSIDANQVLDKMESANNRLNIVILDACRNNPFARSFRSGSVGLAQMDAPVGTLIAFATAPGSVASDGPDQNGLYTKYLLQSMVQPGIKIEDVFKRVRVDVRRDSQGKQIPWESTSLEGDFVFVAQAPAPAAATPATSPEAIKIDSLAAPKLAVGDTWTYQVIDMLSGSVTKTFTRTLKSSTADEWRFGSYVTDKSWNLLRDVRDSDKTPVTWTPRRPTFDFPLYAGKTWKAVSTSESDSSTTEHAFTFRVLRQERVAVPAGVFETLRLEGSTKYKSTSKKSGSSGEGTSTYRYWYSPVAGTLVAYEYEETNWKGVLYLKVRNELVSYKHLNRP
jgi:Caspase domain